MIIAAGSSLRDLGIPGEKEFLGKGVSHCATCDGPFFAGQDVCVVGGGDAALEEAAVLALLRARLDGGGAVKTVQQSFDGARPRGKRRSGERKASGRAAISAAIQSA